jgi:hypothetical protein
MQVGEDMSGAGGAMGKGVHGSAALSRAGSATGVIEQFAGCGRFDVDDFLLGTRADEARVSSVPARGLRASRATTRCTAFKTQIREIE